MFLAVVLDACTRRVVGWAMANHLRTELVLDALNMALHQRQPENVIHHSDQGTQYTSIVFGMRCKQAGVRPSMGSVGDCFDNAMCENFFATLECELITTAENQDTVYAYDPIGRLALVTDELNGETEYAYYQLKETDAFGRERSVELNNDGYGYEFDVEWHYDTANGFLESIQTGPGASATLQNLGYEWDKVGNLKARSDVNQSVTEEFFYDGLNRLDTVQLNSVQTLNVNYNASGRITYKSDVGTYQYNDDPHSVSDITGTRPGSYDYDANGNMTTKAPVGPIS